MPPVSNEHLDQNTRVWNGKEFLMVANAEADKLEEAHKAQKTKNLTAAQLKRPEDFKRDQAAAKKRKQREKQTYGTKEMTADAPD